MFTTNSFGSVMVLKFQLHSINVCISARITLKNKTENIFKLHVSYIQYTTMFGFLRSDY